MKGLFRKLVNNIKKNSVALVASALVSAVVSGGVAIAYDLLFDQITRRADLRATELSSFESSYQEFLVAFQHWTYDMVETERSSADQKAKVLDSITRQYAVGQRLKDHFGDEELRQLDAYLQRLQVTHDAVVRSRSVDDIQPVYQAVADLLDSRIDLMQQLRYEAGLTG